MFIKLTSFKKGCGNNTTEDIYINKNAIIWVTSSRGDNYVQLTPHADSKYLQEDCLKVKETPEEIMALMDERV